MTAGPGTHLINVAADSGAGTYVLVANNLGDTLVAPNRGATLYGGAGNDTLVGGAGADTVIYAQKLSNFTIGKTANGLTLTNTSGAAGVDTLSGIESIQFSDLTINTTVAGKASSISAAQLQSIVELYIAYFNRVPDANGLAYWIDQLKGGQTIEQIGTSFYAAAVQFSSLTGYNSAMSNSDFVKLIYQNVLGRSGSTAPPEADVNYWSASIASGKATRGTLIATMLDSTHGFKGDPTWGWVANLLDNKVTVGEQFAVQMGLSYNVSDDSITHGMAIAAAITPTDTHSAVALIGMPAYSLA